jgi:hypothetical protein
LRSIQGMSDDVVARWRTHMRLGDFEAAWRISDELVRCSTAEQR